jgi:hypothetical protein
VEHAALQRAIEGVERPTVSGSKLLRWYRVHNESLVMFLLRQRRPERYGAKLAIKPGDPLNEKIKREYADEEEVLNSIDQMLEDMRQRRLANQAIFAEMLSNKDDVDGTTD